jgi:hypothetical protein
MVVKWHLHRIELEGHLEDERIVGGGYTESDGDKILVARSGIARMVGSFLPI